MKEEHDWVKDTWIMKWKVGKNKTGPEVVEKN